MLGWARDQTWCGPDLPEFKAGEDARAPGAAGVVAMSAWWLRTVVAGDALWLGVRAARGRGRGVSGATTAGAGVQGERWVELAEVEGVAWPEFGTLAHSFWRAQEVTLFRRHGDLVRGPLVDLGCGDRMFGRLAGWPGGTVGVDYDWESLRAARQLDAGARVVRGDAGRLPLGDAGTAGAVSNSVFEHLPDLAACFGEVERVLRRGGLLVFTMTLGRFTEQLRRLAGERDARRWTGAFGHLQEPSGPEVEAGLRAAGLEVERWVEYQPEWFTARYRLLLSPAFQFAERRLGKVLRERLRPGLARMVEVSLGRTAKGTGACVFVVARKAGR